MNSFQQNLLSKSIELLKYENPINKKPFDLSTIHCSLIDSHPRFHQLKLKVQEYNDSLLRMQLKRPNIQSSYIKKIYTLLSQLTRIPNSDNQIKFLNQIHEWVFPQTGDHTSLNQSKLRPFTSSSSKRMSLSASKIRPGTARIFPKTPRVQKLQQEFVDDKTIQKYSQVNFENLTMEQRDFYLGHRTIHPEEEIPVVRLKQQKSKILIKSQGIKQQKSQKNMEQKRSKLVRIPLRTEMTCVDKAKHCFNNQKKQKKEANIKSNEVGSYQDSQHEQMDREEYEIQSYSEIRPIISKQRLKSYVRQSSSKLNICKLQLTKCLKKQQQERISSKKILLQDRGMANLIDLWTNAKNKVKKEQKRKAESARLIVNNLGYKRNTHKLNTSNKGKQMTEHTVDFSKISTIDLKQNRQKKPFKAHSDHLYGQKMRNALKSGNLGNHIKLHQQGQQKKHLNCFITQRITRCANRSYQQDFQQILKNAKERMHMDTQREIQNTKDTLAKHEISVDMVRLHKSLSHEPIASCDEPFVGIMGLGMVKNQIQRASKKRKGKSLKRANY